MTCLRLPLRAAQTRGCRPISSPPALHHAVIAVCLFCAQLIGGGIAFGAEPPELRARIRALRDGVRDVPLPLIIEEFSGRKVQPWNGECRLELAAVANHVLHTANRDGITAPRVNEAGNAVEGFVLAALAAHGFRAGRPAGPSGQTRAAGYPDLEAVYGGEATAFYIEVKTYSSTTEDSTQRTFYLSPGADFKITRDAIHLLVAVELTPAGDQRYRATRVRWLDLSGLRCDLKHEFNASNRDLYGAVSGLVILEQQAE